MASKDRFTSTEIQEQQAIELEDVKLSPSGTSRPGTFPGGNGQAELPYKTQDFVCDVPVNWRNPGDTDLGKLRLSLSILTPLKRRDGSDLPGSQGLFHSLPVVAYLCGGPGSENQPEQKPELSRYFMEKGYQMLYLDYRGCGRSSPITGETIRIGGRNTAPKQFEYLRHFRQDSIVRDVEAVRRCLQARIANKALKLTLIGQSYGGWIVLTYLSFYPQGIERAYINGGLAPIGIPSETVYHWTYDMVFGYNDLFYDVYPDDLSRVRAVVAHILEKGDRIQLPGQRGYLTARRFLCTGRSLGGPDGLREMHKRMVQAVRDIEEKGELSQEWLNDIEGVFRFNDRPLYALLHDAIYQSGPGGGAASGGYYASIAELRDRVPRSPQSFCTAPVRVAKQEEHSGHYGWVRDGFFASVRPEDVTGEKNTPLYFSGEHVYSWHFEPGMYPGLEGFRGLASEVAACTDWEHLYDIERLRENRVPVYALAYPGDMYVFHAYAHKTAQTVANTTVSWPSHMFHGTLKTNTLAVLEEFEKLVRKEPPLTYERFNDMSTAELLRDMLDSISARTTE